LIACFVISGDLTRIPPGLWLVDFPQ